MCTVHRVFIELVIILFWHKSFKTSSKTFHVFCSLSYESKQQLQECKRRQYLKCEPQIRKSKDSDYSGRVELNGWGERPSLSYLLCILSGHHRIQNSPFVYYKYDSEAYKGTNTYINLHCRLLLILYSEIFLSFSNFVTKFQCCRFLTLASESPFPKAMLIDR